MTQAISETAQKAVARIRSLRDYTRQTGFATTRSQNDILQQLNAVDLADALLALQ